MTQFKFMKKKMENGSQSASVFRLVFEIIA